jgi:hypothetical protein
MKKERLDKLTAALESAGFRLLVVKEHKRTDLWSDGRPRVDSVSKSHPEPRTNSIKWLDIEAEEL